MKTWMLSLLLINVVSAHAGEGYVECDYYRRMADADGQYRNVEEKTNLRSEDLDDEIVDGLNAGLAGAFSFQISDQVSLYGSVRENILETLILSEASSGAAASSMPFKNNMTIQLILNKGSDFYEGICVVRRYK